MSVDLAALHASAERGMMEDAAPEHATARERLLQLHRDAWLDRRPFDAASLAWIGRLASAGHIGAANLLERALEGQASKLAPEVRQALIPLAETLPYVAQFLAWADILTGAPDWQRVAAWLAGGGESCREFAATLQSMRQCGATPGEGDALVIRKLMRKYAPPNLTFGLFDEKSLIYELALPRLAESAREEERRVGLRMMERAVALGLPRAYGSLFLAGWRAAPKKALYLQEWFDAGRPCVELAVAPCLQLGVALERGADGRAQNLEAAIAWYERAIETKAWRAPGVLDRSFCFILASRLADAELARSWIDRGIEAGDERCLSLLVEDSANGGRRFSRGAGDVVERVQKFLATGADVKKLRVFFGPALRALPAAISSAKDAGTAARWREVAALLKGE